MNNPFPASDDSLPSLQEKKRIFLTFQSTLFTEDNNKVTFIYKTFVMYFTTNLRNVHCKRMEHKLEIRKLISPSKPST